MQTGPPDVTGDVAPAWALLPTALGVTEPANDEPLAVFAVGPAGAGRRGVVAALLELDPGLLVVPSGSYLELADAQVATRSAFVPGYRQPHSYGTDLVAAGPALARPPRRVELRLSQPLLRHFALVDTPDTGDLGVAGVRVLLDAVGRGGALLFVVSADQVPDATELDLLDAATRAGVAVFLVVTPGAVGPPPAGPTGPEAGSPGPVRACGAGRSPGQPERTARRQGPRARSDRPGPVRRAPVAQARSDPALVRPDPAVPASSDPAVPASSDPAAPASSDPMPAEGCRAVLLAAIPDLAEAPWFRFRPEDPGGLRRALVDWAVGEGLRRASAEPPGQPGGTCRVPVATVGEAGDWSGAVDRRTRLYLRQIRQNISLELAAIHLRAVRDVLFGAGVAGLPALLDRELHALSLLGTIQCDLAVHQILDDGCAQIFGTTTDAVHRRVADAVCWGLTGAGAGPELDRAFLVTSTAGLVLLPGGSGAHPAYLGAERAEVLPPLAVALAGGCYQHWGNPGNDDPGAARSWVQRAVREVELELLREMSRRFEAVRRSLKLVLSDASDHGFLRT